MKPIMRKKPAVMRQTAGLRTVIGLLLLTAVFFTRGLTALGAEEEYTYTVRLYAGNLGELTRGGIEINSDSAEAAFERDQVVITGLKYGDMVSIRPQDAAVPTDAKYHVKGVRRSGRDNSEAEAPAFYVGSDRDFVVAYAVSGDMVAYTVNYVDESGAQIMESDTYYGNIGERQYVSSRYIDGYQPQSLNMVQTLSSNETENVFTFAYAPVETQAPAVTPTPAPTAPAATPTPAPAPAEEPAEEPGVEIPEEEVPLGGDVGAAPENETEPGQQIDDEEVPRASGQEFLEDKDIADESVPLGTYKDEKKNTEMGYLPVYVGIGSAAVAILVVAAVLLRKRRKPAEVKSAGREGRKSGGRGRRS